MTTPSNAAKAAALLNYTSGCNTAKQAVEIFDALLLCTTDEEMDEVLTKHETPRWEQVDHMDWDEWWDQIWMLAKSIDACREELK